MTETTAQPDAVPLGLLRRYLRGKGWTHPARASASVVKPVPKYAEALRAVRGKPARSDFDIWELSDGGGEPIPVIVPSDINTPEHLERLERTIKTLAALEQRAPDDIIADIRSIGFDRIFSRVPDSLVRDDSIHLLVAANHIRDMRNLLAANATTELLPAPFFPKMVKQATDYADSCRFGHTFRGSFGFTIESPLQQNIDPTLPNVIENAPFERRVIERFARGVQAVVHAQQNEDTKPIIESVATGFSANTCEQFAKLIEETSPGGMHIRFAFSSEWRASPDLMRMPEYQVDRRHVEVTREAAKILRAQPSARQETISGLIVDLHARHDPMGLFGGSKSDHNVVIAWRPEGSGAEIQVFVPLSQDDYLKAVGAHGKGSPITISGLLERRGPRSWVLANITEIKTETTQAT
jgi:hypothetical protein